jgi:hypothetical protein
MDSFGSPCVASVPRTFRDDQQQDVRLSRTRQRLRNSSSNPRTVIDDKKTLESAERSKVQRPKSTPKFRSPKLSDSTDRQRQIRKEATSKIIRSYDEGDDIFEGLERQKTKRPKSPQKKSTSQQQHEHLHERTSSRRKPRSSRRDGDTMIDVYVDSSSYGDEYRKAEIRRLRNERIATLALERSKLRTMSASRDNENAVEKQNPISVRSYSEKRKLKRSTRTVLNDAYDRKVSHKDEEHSENNENQIIDMRFLDCLRANVASPGVSIGTRFADCLLVTADALGDESSSDDQDEDVSTPKIRKSDDNLSTPKIRKSKPTNSDNNTLSTANSSYDSPNSLVKNKVNSRNKNRCLDQTESRASASIVPSSTMSASESTRSNEKERHLLNLSTSLHSSSNHTTSKRPPLVLTISTDELAKHGEMHRKYQDRCSPQKAKLALGVAPNETHIRNYNRNSMVRVPVPLNNNAIDGKKNFLQSMTYRNAPKGDAIGEPRNFYSRKHGDECSIPFDEQSGTVASNGPGPWGLDVSNNKSLRRPRRPLSRKYGEEIPFDECSGPKAPMPQNIPYLVYNYRTHPSGYGFMGTPTPINPSKLNAIITAPRQAAAFEDMLDPARFSNHGYNRSNPVTTNAKLNSAQMVSPNALQESSTPIHLSPIDLVRKFDNSGNTLQVPNHVQTEKSTTVPTTRHAGTELSKPDEKTTTGNGATQVGTVPRTDLPPDEKIDTDKGEEKNSNVPEDVETKYQIALKDLEAQDQIIQKLMSEYQKTREVLSQMQMEINTTKEESLEQTISPRVSQELTKIAPKVSQELTKVVPKVSQEMTKIAPKVSQELTKVVRKATVQDLLDADDKIIPELNINQSLLKTFNDLKEQTKNLKRWLWNPEEENAVPEPSRCKNNTPVPSTPPHQSDTNNEPPGCVSFIGDMPTSDELDYSFSTIGENGSFYSEQDIMVRLQAEITEARSNRLQAVERLVTLSRCQTPTDLDTKSLQKRFENIKKCRSSTSSNNGSIASSTKTKDRLRTCTTGSSSNSTRSKKISPDNSLRQKVHSTQYETSIQLDESFQSNDTGLSSTSSGIQREREELEQLRTQVAILSNRLKLTNELGAGHQRKAIVLENEVQSTCATSTDATTLRVQVDTLITELNLSKQEHDEKSIDTASNAKSLQEEVNRIKQKIVEG